MSRLALPAIALALVAAAGGCTMNDVCNPGQVLNAVGYCVCDGNAVLSVDGDSCVPCPEHGHAAGAACACDDGFLVQGGECVVAAPGLGDACDTTDCPEPAYPYCAPDATCTVSGCAGDQDCPGGYACETDTVPTYCRRPPRGQGRSCASSADCAGTEATFCDTFITHTCLVEHCQMGGNDCFPGWECCDLTPFTFPTVCGPPEVTCPTA